MVLARTWRSLSCFENDVAPAMPDVAGIAAIPRADLASSHGGSEPSLDESAPIRQIAGTDAGTGAAARGAFRRSPQRPCGRGCRRTGMTEPLASDRFRLAAVEPCAPLDCCAGTSVASQRSPCIICTIASGMSGPRGRHTALDDAGPAPVADGTSRPRRRIGDSRRPYLMRIRLLAGICSTQWGWRFSVRRRGRRRAGRFSCRPGAARRFASREIVASWSERRGCRVAALPEVR